MNNQNDKMINQPMTQEEYIECYWNHMHRDAQEVLNRELSTEQFDSMLDNWKAFSMNPKKYVGTTVPFMVRQWLCDQATK